MTSEVPSNSVLITLLLVLSLEKIAAEYIASRSFHLVSGHTLVRNKQMHQVQIYKIYSVWVVQTGALKPA